MAGLRKLVKPDPAVWVLALACAVLWILKLWLVSRININWDEFYFLTLIHAQTRGELSQGLQTAYTHLFTWLPASTGNEISQIRIARALMVILLGTSTLLIRTLASRCFPPRAAWTAALAFLAMWPTLKHGGSFRADSLLLPLELAALAVLTHDKFSDRNRGLGAGLLLGAATVVSIKAVLLAPVVVPLAFWDCRHWQQGVRRVGWLCAAGIVTAAVLFGAHYASLGDAGTSPTSSAASSALQKTVLSSAWIPQPDTLHEQVHKDMAFWLVAACGLAWALSRRAWLASACALALLPILFYRNSFAYFYVVMWGPACVTFAAAAQGVQEGVSHHATKRAGSIAALSIPAVLFILGLRQMQPLATPSQGGQQDVITAAHEIFPTPVAYIDHSGMIASFTKANFFMSTWGIEQYQAQGRPFMPTVLKQYRPPLLVANRSVITPGSLAFSLLLDKDKQLIESYYQPYWGPIRIAGAAATLQPGVPMTLRFPFGGRYRLESRKPIRIEGLQRLPQTIVTVPDDRPELRMEVDSQFDEAQPVRLLWAEARPAPDELPPTSDLYAPL